MARTASKECTPEEEHFCRLVIYDNMAPRDAAVEAGWSPNTIRSRGTKYLMERPRIVERMKAMSNEILTSRSGPGKNLRTVFLSVAGNVEDAIGVLADLMNDETVSASVRQRSAATLVDMGKGILIAQMPKRVTFEVLMSQLALEAQERVDAGEVIDITPSGNGKDENGS